MNSICWVWHFEYKLDIGNSLDEIQKKGQIQCDVGPLRHISASFQWHMVYLQKLFGNIVLNGGRVSTFQTSPLKYCCIQGPSLQSNKRNLPLFCFLKLSSKLYGGAPGVFQAVGRRRSCVFIKSWRFKGCLFLTIGRLLYVLLLGASEYCCMAPSALSSVWARRNMSPGVFAVSGKPANEDV